MAVTFLKTKGGKITMVPRKLAADTKMVVNDVLTTEDEFKDLYWSDKNSKCVVLEPPFPPRTLYAMAARNNTLLQCISAMEVNIAGTGYEIVPTQEKAEEAAAADKAKADKTKFDKATVDFAERERVNGEADKAKPDENGNMPPPPRAKEQPPEAPSTEVTAEEKLNTDPEKIALEQFFNEPFPGQSFTIQHRLLQVDLETIGNGYLEILRDGTGEEVVMTRWLDGTTMRLARLDDPVPVEKSVERGGKEFKAEVMMRERRFVQKAGTTLLYFKEFGASRDLDRKSGEWAPKGTKLPLDQRASEVIWLTMERDPTTSYGVPRWINQLPSVLGSRKAEEYNLEFFDSGGMPPAVFFILGGAATPDAAEQLKAYLAGGAKYKHRAAVVEIQSTTGALEGSGTVNVKTERFGDAKTSDSQFQTYDKNTETHVRGAFRLPPIFLGKAEDYNFATAMTGVMITEEQVFEPEREEFDEVMNKKVIRALGVKGFEYKSKAMSLKNAEIMLAGLALVGDKVSGEDLIEAVNEVTGLTLIFDQETADKAAKEKEAQAKAAFGGTGAPGPGQGLPQRPSAGGTNPANPFGAKKSEALSPTEVLTLAGRWAQAVGLEDGTDPMTEVEKKLILKITDALPPSNRILFDAMVSKMTFSRTALDPSGLAKIAGCAARHLH